MKHIIVAAFVSSFLSVESLGAIPVHLFPTEEEKAAMHIEADDFIDNLPEGIQDRQCDAVVRALKGFAKDLDDVRNSRNAGTELSSDVERIDLKGDGSVNGICMRLYRPKNRGEQKLPLLVYFHGGGWTFGSINSCSRFCDALAATGKSIVLAVDYSLAPENPFPKGLNDCVGAFEYASEHAEEWGADYGLVSLGGDSSGGNLAIATALCLGNMTENKPNVKSLLLFYPVVKAYDDGSESWQKYSKGYGLDGRLMDAFNAAYLKADVANADDGLVSPSDALDEVLGKLPATLLIAAERDILCNQGEDFINRLKRLGVEAERIEFPGAVHLFITVDGQPTSFKKSVEMASHFLKD